LKDRCFQVFGRFLPPGFCKETREIVWDQMGRTSRTTNFWSKEESRIPSLKRREALLTERDPQHLIPASGEQYVSHFHAAASTGKAVLLAAGDFGWNETVSVIKTHQKTTVSALPPKERPRETTILSPLAQSSFKAMQCFHLALRTMACRMAEDALGWSRSLFYF